MPQIVSFNDLQQLDIAGALIVRAGHVGDIVACEPIIGYLKDQLGHKVVAWAVMKKYAEILHYHPRLDYLILVDDHNQALAGAEEMASTWITVKLYYRFDPEIDPKYGLAESGHPELTYDNYYNYGSLMQSMALSSGLPLIKTEPKLYTSLDNSYLREKYGRYVVFHCQSKDEARNWDAQKWNELASFFSDDQVYVLEIGVKRTINIDVPYYIDMTSNRSLSEIAKIIEDAYFFIGVDSGFAHMANALLVNGLVIMGKFHIWNCHIPFTGQYERGHTIRVHNLPAYFTPIDGVIDFYRQLTKSDHDHKNDKLENSLNFDDDTAECQRFPNNIMQKLILSLYRRYLKYTANSKEYTLFTQNRKKFLSRPDMNGTDIRVVRCVLKMFGPIPPIAKVFIL